MIVETRRHPDRPTATTRSRRRRGFLVVQGLCASIALCAAMSHFKHVGPPPKRVRPPARASGTRQPHLPVRHRAAAEINPADRIRNPFDGRATEKIRIVIRIPAAPAGADAPAERIRVDRPEAEVRPALEAAPAAVPLDHPVRFPPCQKHAVHGQTALDAPAADQFLLRRRQRLEHGRIAGDPRLRGARRAADHQAGGGRQQPSGNGGETRHAGKFSTARLPCQEQSVPARFPLPPRRTG